MCRVFANDPGHWGSIPGRILPRLKNSTWCRLAKHYKVMIKGNVKQSWEWSRALSNTILAIENRALGSPSIKVANLLYYTKYSYLIHLIYESCVVSSILI